MNSFFITHNFTKYQFIKEYYFIEGDNLVLYVDLIMIITSIIHIIYIKSISIVYKVIVNRKRLILSTTFCSLSIMLYILPISIFLIIRHFYGLIIGTICFKNKKHILVYYILNYLLIGIINIFKINNLLIILLSSIVIIILFMTEHLLKNYNFEKDVYISNIKLKALVDSGNICYYQNIPVTFINKKYFSNDFLKIGELLTTCLTSEVLVDIYIGPNIVIDKKGDLKVIDYDTAEDAGVNEKTTKSNIKYALTYIAIAMSVSYPDLCQQFFNKHPYLTFDYTGSFLTLPVRNVELTENAPTTFEEIKKALNELEDQTNSLSLLRN